MGTLGDALGAIRRVILLDERIYSQSRKLEQLADAMVAMERRLATMEGRIDGFLAAAAAFGAAGRPGQAAPKPVQISAPSDGITY